MFQMRKIDTEVEHNFDGETWHRQLQQMGSTEYDIRDPIVTTTRHVMKDGLASQVAAENEGQDKRDLSGNTAS